MNITDESGIQYATLSFQNPSLSGFRNVSLTYDENLKLWVGNYTVKATDEGGTYRNFSMIMCDNAGNYLHSDSVLDPFKNSITFTIKR